MGRLPAALAALMLILSCLPAASAQEGETVVEIVFRGNRRDSESSLKYKIRTKEGQRYTEARVDEDVTTLRAFFDRVTVETESAPGGIRLIFLVEETPVVSSVVFRGFGALSETEVQQVARTRRGLPFTTFRIEDDQTKLQTMLKEKGYYFAEVQVAVGDYGEGKQVVFTAIEGPKVKVDEIEFVGNGSFDGDELEDQMLTEEAWLFNSGIFEIRTLEQDLVALANFYRAEGWLDVAVDLRRLDFAPDKKDVVITIGIEEGEPYLIETVEITGNRVFPTDQLLALVKIAPGDRRREEDVLLSRRALRNFHLEQAYYDVRVRVEDVPDPVAKTTRLRFVIEEGQPVRLRRILVEGNRITREDVVHRYVSVYPGGPLNSIEVEKSLSRLEETTFFEPGRVGATVLDTGESGVKDLLITLEEGRTGSIRSSAGVTSDLGILGLIDLRKRNFDYADWPDRFGQIFGGGAFTGGGQTLDLMLSPGTALSQYRLSFYEPWFLDEYIFTGPSGAVEESPFSLGFEIYHTLFTKFDYDEGRTGTALSTGKTWRIPRFRMDDVFRARTGFRLENIRIDDLESEAPPSAFLVKGTNRAHRFDLDLGWRRVDLPASPGKGVDVDFSYQLTGGILGGEIDFHKLEFGTTTWLTLHTTKDERRHILALTGRVGVAEEFGSSDQVPIFDRFFLGGHRTLRGFPYGEVGPRAEGNPNTNRGRRKIRRSLRDGKGDPLGGEGMWLFRAEYGYPIYETGGQEILRGILFLDAGAVADTFGSDLTSDYRASVGFGVRIRIPFFGPTPIALDFGWPIRSEEGDDHQVLSFSIDRPF